MKVDELIALLQQLPQEVYVVVRFDSILTDIKRVEYEKGVVKIVCRD